MRAIVPTDRRRASFWNVGRSLVPPADSTSLGTAMFRVTREIEFCYGHRLLNYAGKCRYLHGHNGIAIITIEGSELDDRGRVGQRRWRGVGCPECGRAR